MSRFAGALIFSLLLLLASFSIAQSLEMLTEEEMGVVTGQEGILISLDYYHNSEKTNNPATDGQALAGFCSVPNGGTSLGDMDCRMAIQIANHEDHWVVVKNGHASISVNRISLDAAFLGDASSESSANVNLGKFLAPNGDCLIGVGGCTSEAAAANLIKQMPGLRTHYAETSGSYDATNRVSVGYNDVRFGMFIEGMAVEFNTAVNLQDGWTRNQNGSFLGLKVADNNGHQAGIAFGGDFYLYGF